MVDSRPLQRNLRTADTNTLTAVINYVYAQKHGYPFAYEHLRLRPSAPSVRGHNLDTGDKAAHCRHAKFGWERVAPWCKLLGIWDAVRRPRSRSVLYLDSDAVVHNQSLSIADALASSRVSPPPARSNYSILAGSNFPWANGKGTSGTLLLNTASSATSWILLNWWNTAEFPDYHSRHDFEQAAWRDGVWNWAGGQLGARGVIGVVDWKAFKVDGKKGAPEPFLRHIGSDEGSARAGFFRAELRRHGVSSSRQFSEVVDAISACCVHLPTLQALEGEISLPVEVPLRKGQWG